MKKIVASASTITLLAMNMAYAATFTGSLTGGQNTPVDIDSTWDGTSTPSGTTATGFDTVLVSAQVAPVLTMNISSDAIAFGNLAPNTPNLKSINLTTATNAENGISIGMDSNGLQSASKYIGAYGRTIPTPTTDASDYYKVSSLTNAGGVDLAQTDVDGTTTQTILTTDDVAKSNAITAVNLTAMAGNQTEAGNYGDTLTFTVTGNF